MEREINRKAKQLWSGLMAFFIMLLLTSCHKQSDSVDYNSQVWVPEFLPLEMTEDSYYSIAFLGNAFYYISYQHQDESFIYRLSGYSLADGSLPDIPLSWPDDRSRFVTDSLAIDEEGGIYLIAYVTEEDSSRTHLCKFDAKGMPIYDVDISTQTNDADLLTVDSQGRAYISGSISGKPCVLLYTSDGNYYGTAMPDVPNGRISAMGLGHDGSVYARCYGNSGGGDTYFLAQIDFDNKKADASSPDFPKGDNSTLIPGMENSLLSYDRTTLYAYNLAERTGEALFDWLDYDINGSYVAAVNVLEDGRLLVIIREIAAENCELALLKKVDSAQAIQKETIVLGTLYSNSTLRNAVLAFNRGNNQYHVKIKEYLDPQTHDQADAVIRMNNDILSDDCPDILDLADLNLKALASKGLFTDLNDYMEKSSLLSRSDFLDSLLNTYTVNSKLITIPTHFSIKTVMGWRADVGNDMGWSLEELMAYADAHPDTELFDNTSRSELMQYLMCYNEDSFIDWSSGECRFDSDAFIQLLEFVGRFPEKAERNPEQSSTPVRIRNGEVLLYKADISGFDSIQLPLEIYGNEGTCIGFPAADGSAGCMLIPYGAYAITIKSDLKEGAWAFIESLLASESSNSFFPPQKAQLAQQAADAVKAEYLTDEDGKVCLDENGEPVIKNTGMSISYSDWEFTYHTASREEADLVLDLIAAAKPVSCSDGNEVIKIINEESEGFYQGQKTAAEAAKIIQSRIQIYVNELSG